MTCALLIQGAWHHRWTERFAHYAEVFDQIVISCYKSDITKAAQYPHILNHPKTTLVLNHSWFPPGADWYGNIWYQCLTTRAGLQQVRTDHVIKTRSDEYFSNLDLMRDEISRQSCNISINIYFKRPCWFPFHIGDHLYGGRTTLFRQAFDILEQSLLVDRWNSSSHAAEQKICISILEAAGEKADIDAASLLMNKHWNVIDAALLEPFWFNAPSVGTVGCCVADIQKCEELNPTVELFDSVDKYYR
jgi:hypothetical protein